MTRLISKLFFAAMAGLLVFAFFESGHFAATKPREPNILAGRIYPLNVHGTVVFLNEEEKNIQSWSFYCGVFSGLMSGLLWKLSEDKSK
jgi:hypothetical protein